MINYSTISGVIKKLQEIQDKHGDLPVVYEAYGLIDPSTFEIINLDGITLLDLVGGH